LFHRLSDRLRSDQRAADVDGEITVETVARLLGERRLAHRCGVVMQDVDCAVLLLDVGDQVGNALRIARIHLANAGAASIAYQSFGQLLRPRNAASGQHHLKALFGKAFGGRKAHSRARSDAEKGLHRLSLFDAEPEIGDVTAGSLTASVVAT